MNQSDTIDQVTVNYFATFRGTGRRCRVDLVDLLTPGRIEDWDRNGWDVSTVAQTDPVPVFGTLTCVGVSDDKSELARVRMELELAKSERDEYRSQALNLVRDFVR